MKLCSAGADSWRINSSIVTTALEQTLWMVCSPSLSVHAKDLSLGLQHIILPSQTKMSKWFCFPNCIVCFKVPSACDLLQNRINRAIWWHFIKWLQCLLPRDIIPRICAICSVLLSCEMKPTQRLSAVSTHYPQLNPWSQVLNWVSFHFNYLPMSLWPFQSKMDVQSLSPHSHHCKIKKRK